MSTSELIPLFPSATHPAIPIASQILFTLRHLTAPGKGNDLKPEERAALVGISALLGCERVQSKDLIEKSAQKASSVSPAHFRSALLHARRILETVTVALDSSPTSSRHSSRASSSVQPSPPSKTLPGATVSPFQTPKKRFKYSSGVDLSGLVRSPLGHGHEPVRGSPLKQSVTPSKLRDRLIRTAEEIDLDAGGLVEEDEGEGEDGDGGEQQKTPTKKVKYATRPGVDLEIAVPGPSSVGSGEKRKRVDTSAFFALRPGSRGTPTTMDKQWSPVVEDGLPEVRSRVRKEREEGGERVRKDKVVVPRRDWTYAEIVWGSKEVVEENEKVLDQIWSELPAWLAEHDLPPISETTPRGSTLLEVLLSSTRSEVTSLDMEIDVEI